MKDFQFLGVSTFGIIQSITQYFNPVVTGLISLVTLLYVIEKYRILRNKNKPK